MLRTFQMTLVIIVALAPNGKRQLTKSPSQKLLFRFQNNLVQFGTIGPTGPRSAVGNVSGYRCVSDCRSRGREFDPGPVPYFRGD